MSLGEVSCHFHRNDKFVLLKHGLEHKHSETPSHANTTTDDMVSAYS